MAAFIIVVVVPLAAFLFMLRHRRLAFYSALVIAIAIVIAIAVYAFPHCVSAGKLHRIAEGMPRQELIALLGPSQSTETFSDGRSRLAYTKTFRYCTLDVFLDSSEHVTGFFHDH